MDIAGSSDSFEFSVDVMTANKLLTALDESSEWSQSYLLEAVLTVCPEDPKDAEQLADRISPRLQHSNSGVVIAAVRVVLYLSSYMPTGEQIIALLKKCGPPLVTLLHSRYEVQYVALCNIQLILQKHRDFLKSDIKVFFCKYNDPIYIKLAKLEILLLLADATNIFDILSELKEYSTEVDVDFVRKAVRSIGRCAIKVAQSAEKCVEILVELIESKIDYVLQEAIVAIKDIFRKYQNRFESVIKSLCENVNIIEEPEAKASIIWIIGQYSERIPNACELLTLFVDNFVNESAVVQLTLLTAVVKVYLRQPTAGQALIPRILKYSTEDVHNPDLRDRGFMYYRLLSSGAVEANAIIFGEKPPISIEPDQFDASSISRLLYNISTLSSLTQKPPPISQEMADKLLQLYNQSSKLLLETYVEQKSVPIEQFNTYKDETRVETTNRELVEEMESLDFMNVPMAQGYASLIYGEDLPLDLFANNNVTPTPYVPYVYQESTPTSNVQSPTPSAMYSTVTPTIHDRSVAGPAIFNVPNPSSQSPAIIDPFSRTHSSPKESPSPISKPLKILFVSAQPSPSIEIFGAISRRSNSIYLDVRLTNTISAVLSDFAILFNKNTYSTA